MIDANMITPDQFTSVGTAWIDAFAVVVGHFLSQTGMIVAAVYGLVKAVQTGAASLKELQAQQDAQGARIEAMEKGLRSAPPAQEPPAPSAEVLHA